MQKLDENSDLDQKKDLTPLGVEEMNTMIKSFQESSFNEEEIYQKEVKPFVKKSLYELAIESTEKEKNNTNKIEPDETEVKEETSSNSETSIAQEDLQNLDNTDKDSIEEENSSEEKKFTDGEVPIDTNEIDAEVHPIEDNNNVPEEKTLVENDEKKLETQTIQKDEKRDVEQNEGTLEALDSVREAVSKSLEQQEENEENQVSEKSNNVSEEENNIENIQKNFQEIVNLFDDIKKLPVVEIEKVIKEKIFEISSEIAGYQIDKLPQKFLQKIKIVLDDLTNINDQVSIILNKDDLQAINKVKLDLGKKIKFEESENMSRGEFTINSGGLLHSINYQKKLK